MVGASEIVRNYWRAEEEGLATKEDCAESASYCEFLERILSLNTRFSYL